MGHFTSTVCLQNSTKRLSARLSISSAAEAKAILLHRYNRSRLAGRHTHDAKCATLLRQLLLPRCFYSACLSTITELIQRVVIGCQDGLERLPKQTDIEIL